MYYENKEMNKNEYENENTLSVFLFYFDQR